jgi:hypothetical protein
MFEIEYDPDVVWSEINICRRRCFMSYVDFK